ncbi:MAG: hypothetical protein HY754_04630 [Nitrospirae bacterium]|nr:hypothetical protein [Nitrospirota bacterium]
MDKELREYLEGFKEELKRYITDSFNAKAEELSRQVGIISEEFQRRIDLVVEGHEVLDRKIDELKEEMTFELKEIKSLTKTLFKDLDHRVKVLERIKH